MAEPNSDGAGELLERSPELSELEAIGARRNGRVVVVTGEAGIGKTALLHAFRDAHASGPRFLWGACDPLFTPRPLGSVNDVAEQTGGELCDLVTRGTKPFRCRSVQPACIASMFFIMTASVLRSSSAGLKITNSVPGSCFTGTWPGGV
jgi:hypothetical protein